MAKTDKGAVLSRLQSSARLTRTALAARLLMHGFYAGQDQIMLALAAEEGQTPSQLANRLGVRPPTITKTINRLQMQGFLNKSASTEDGRQAHITLTETGRDAIKSIEKSIRKTEKQALKGLDKKDQRTLLKLLGKIEGNFNGAVDESLDEAAELDEPVPAE
ncbi:MarR family winged helix-turn-helix transcriptional regulator [Tianweitania sediminis]|jgi:DNA-binding MarR family transcriptional regulator|uniref:MarR family transcriptional regulator n=1 Tax=Tianweitania sediminis TaxID=1502156 RepID=A0A8J7RM05_9HYPH|nr:MarR family transcriptional regulator [Tianweitania sediminis]MBP0438204.1 MarR family transcriptional regulator [Tianweitania sediminis]HEV7415862.1 MarR family transcriptional regulator [Tianweitania sediminis]